MYIAGHIFTRGFTRTSETPLSSIAHLEKPLFKRAFANTFLVKVPVIKKFHGAY